MRNARATPSPVETAGLVVAEKTCPMPPVASTTAGACTAPTPSCWPSPMTCRVTPAVRPSASVSRSRTSAFSMVRSPAARTAPTSAREISAPVASPPHVRDTTAVVAALAGERYLVAARGGVEAGSGTDEPVDGVRALGHKGPDGGLVAESGARDEGVGQMLLRGVAVAERGRDPALCPACGAVVQTGLGDDDGPAAGRGAAQRGGQPGHPGAHHDDVRCDGPAGGGGGQAYSGACGRAGAGACFGGGHRVAPRGPWGWGRCGGCGR